MRTFVNLASAAAILFMVAACGTTTTDRALSGAGIGAAGGAATGALTGGSPVTGALLGGAAGAAVGGLTSEKNFNLGKPIWR
jgi:osmotically inducible lipoprotein OsmB